tara:strand:+ start:1862 stop:2401 length:540 start_codon:yes stop_codon:yes gene_type:complete
MAKKDSFFIRANVNYDNGGAYNQTEIDLGSFVNLGVSSSTLLRIHQVQVQYADGDTTTPTVELPIYSTVATGCKIAWQLTTQSQGGLVLASDKSVVATGSLSCYGDPNSTAHALGDSDSIDINPAEWKNGYLVGVDSMFLGCELGGTIASGDGVVSIIIECTLEKATQASATALALSQQ